MDWAWIAVFGTITAAVVAWAIAEVFRSRTAWAAGALLAGLHSLAAFEAFYGWSHDIALEMTRRQTAALIGVDFRGGIYFNYAFIALWTLDALQWLMADDGDESRSRPVSLAIRGFIFFMIVNGAVIFADGLARVIGALCVTAVVLAWTSRAPRFIGR